MHGADLHFVWVDSGYDVTYQILSAVALLKPLKKNCRMFHMIS